MKNRYIHLINMNKIIQIAAIAVLLCIVSCGNKQAQSDEMQSKAKDVQSQTVKDLKDAIDGEATAHAKYAAFARQASLENLPRIAALFQATSQAESIHLQNHEKALQAIGEEYYKPVVKSFEVKTTAKNLQAAIEGEKYEFTTMYPHFFADAQRDYEDGAAKSFKWAFRAEQKHAQLYQYALANIHHPEKQAKVYFVCPTCGNVDANRPTEICEICGTSGRKFLRFAASSEKTKTNK